MYESQNTKLKIFIEKLTNIKKTKKSEKNKKIKNNLER